MKTQVALGPTRPRVLAALLFDCQQESRKSPKGCVQILDRITEIWPEV